MAFTQDMPCQILGVSEALFTLRWHHLLVLHLTYLDFLSCAFQFYISPLFLEFLTVKLPNHFVLHLPLM